MTTKKTSLTFILPGRGTYPVGGFRIVYEYANRLTATGMDITIVHVAWLYKSHSFIIGLGRYLYCLLFYRFYKKWFNLDSKVKNKWVFIPKSYLIPNADFVVATAWETAEHVIEYPDKKGKKIYFIQGNESELLLAIKKGWQQRVKNTWNFPMHKIAISSWLKEIVSTADNPAKKIFNGLNFDEFYINNPIETREPASVMMLYHTSPAKGCTEALEAINILKKSDINLKVKMFGVPQRPENLAEWIEYYQQPERETLRKLYNEVAIFLSPSHSEGWGLPVAESMLCGCAVITTNIGGFKDFVIDGNTGLNFKREDVNDMVQKIKLLIHNNDTRIKIAQNGNSFIKQFSWDRAISDMKELLSEFK
ncbi:glycosyltransferase family 4 protein [Mucilaginibacter sp. KACC 22063]|uniref:glycosyltransferase family 4 protein n=1 Tax=Mucilaginibacter sp. KACC 22063 TaxID=3025666 RepID=UPI002367230F|nr:glycosyltransferase family 4 protein [Mucilaginibacter sp. KACC 22063]WDF54713.1 glycosyltransferase family 4 protein [Mucilaginibacter sp. KACC 22063]